MNSEKESKKIVRGKKEKDRKQKSGRKKLNREKESKKIARRKKEKDNKPNSGRNKTRKERERAHKGNSKNCL